MIVAQVAGYQFAGGADFRGPFLLQLLPAAIFLPGFWSVQCLGEEIGWRGFLLPRLMKAGFGQWEALLVTGAIWGLWHAPGPLSGCVFRGHWFLGIVMFTVGLILLGVVFGWLMLASGSVWVPAVAHAAIDTIGRREVFLLVPGYNYFLVGDNGSILGWGVYTVFIAWLAWTSRLPVRSREVSELLGPARQPEGQYAI
jgi:membrane protease YdiL (CAAX protease family)